MGWVKATDTFVGDLGGISVRVMAGEAKPDTDPVVKTWPGLFKPLEEPAEAEPEAEKTAGDAPKRSATAKGKP
jgi:hypothetical protein